MSGCLLWSGSVTRLGYGVFSVRGRTVMAHRAAVLLAGSPLPPGIDAAHRCHNRLCVSADHVRPLTHAENMAESRGLNAASYDDRRGERNWNARLTADDVLAIRSAFSEGAAQETLASRFGITQAAVSQIVNGHRWRHLLSKKGGAR